MKLFSILNKKDSEAKTQPSTEASNEKTTLYALLGGEEGVSDIANGFYDVMETAPEAKQLLDIHPLPLTSIRQRFFEYLSGWFGGPPLFEAKYGHPRLRARHLPYPVTPILKEQWMFCMYKTLEQHVQDPQLRNQILSAFADLAEHMINRPNQQQSTCPSGQTTQE